MKQSLHKHYLIAFWVTLSVALSLIVGGFFAPPMGEVSGSVLTGVGEIFLWPALAFGAKALQEGKTAHIRKGDMDIAIGEDTDGEL